MPKQTVICPDCGLVVDCCVPAAGKGVDFKTIDWRRKCKRPALGSPLWCFIQRDGTAEIAPLPEALELPVVS